eukprot:116950-Amphidinium_carterae.1
MRNRAERPAAPFSSAAVVQTLPARVSSEADLGVDPCVIPLGSSVPVEILGTALEVLSVDKAMAAKFMSASRVFRVGGHCCLLTAGGTRMACRDCTLEKQPCKPKAKRHAKREGKAPANQKRCIASFPLLTGSSPWSATLQATEDHQPAGGGASGLSEK